MRFGVREICDVVLRAKAPQKVGNKVFYKGEPVIYFDTLKTSSMEGAATTVYAQGGRGNARLIAWDGERTVTWNMEDALISPESFSILTGAGLMEATAADPIIVHTTEQTDNIQKGENGKAVSVYISKKPSTNSNAGIYIMAMKNGEIVSEPFIPTGEPTEVVEEYIKTSDKEIVPNKKYYTLEDGEYEEVDNAVAGSLGNYYEAAKVSYELTFNSANTCLGNFDWDVALVDYYVEHASGAMQIDITPDKFGGNYYLEASTLFRTTNGVDLPAEFIIPNCKIQSNFTFSMASSGDPSTFSFVMDSFPDYTRFDPTKKVLAAIQIITDLEDADELVRHDTCHEPAHDAYFEV